MPKTQTPVQQPLPPAQKPVLGKQLAHDIIKATGRPLDFCRVDVKKLTTKFFRCNVLVRDGMFGLPKITDSFFVELDDNDHIVRSEPVLAPKY